MALFAPKPWLSELAAHLPGAVAQPMVGYFWGSKPYFCQWAPKPGRERKHDSPKKMRNPNQQGSWPRNEPSSPRVPRVRRFEPKSFFNCFFSLNADTEIQPMPYTKTSAPKVLPSSCRIYRCRINSMFWLQECRLHCCIWKKVPNLLEMCFCGNDLATWLTFLSALFGCETLTLDRTQANWNIFDLSSTKHLLNISSHLANIPERGAWYLANSQPLHIVSASQLK